MSRPTNIGFREFVVLAAAMMATQAIAVDAMLPAFPTLVRALAVSDANRAQWVVTAYVGGMGVGQLFWGFLSDRFGRRPILLWGIAFYALAAVLCALSQSFEALLAWRLVHGLAAASLVVSRSVIRDLYSGRPMARVMSLTFIVFLMVPVIAPSLGQLVLLLAPWRYIFLLFGAFSASVGLWILLRLPETLHPEYRLTLDPKHMAHAARLVLGNRTSICYSLAMTVMFGSLLSYVGMVQQIFAVVFQRPALMPLIFGLCAGSMGVASFFNAKIVERLGMRIISHTALLAFIAVALVHSLVATTTREPMWAFVVLQAATMSAFSLAVSNFGAMAMEPLGQIAGIGASLQGFLSTSGGALVGAAIGHYFAGTVAPLAVGALLAGSVSLLCVLLAEQGRLFRPHHGAPEAAAEFHM